MTNESHSDFAQRLKAAADTYTLLKLAAPTDENQATRFKNPRSRPGQILHNASTLHE